MLELENPKPKLLCAETIRSEQKIPFCASAQGGEDSVSRKTIKQ